MATSNPVTGAEFEKTALRQFGKLGYATLERGFAVDVGVAEVKKAHRFDLGSHDEKLLVGCKAHTWTSGGNAPSAKLSVWNEAMYYFLTAPSAYRKVLFTLRSERNGETLAQHYVKRYRHLIPPGVEIWEYDPASDTVAVIDSFGASG